MSKKKTDIWMPLYIAEYLGDTMHLTTRQHGAYLLLIMAYWRSASPLPNNERQLAAICKMHPSEWEEDRDTLAGFFETDETGWHHKRIDIELANALDNVQKASEKGRAGAAARWQKDAAGNATGNATGNAQGNSTGNASSPSPISTTDVVDIRAQRAVTVTKAVLVSEHRVPEQVAADFLTVRKAKRAPLTQTAFDGLVKEFRKAGLSVSQGIALCAANSWQGFKSEWLDNQAKKSRAESMAFETYKHLIEDGTLGLLT